MKKLISLLLCLVLLPAAVYAESSFDLKDEWYYIDADAVGRCVYNKDGSFKIWPYGENSAPVTVFHDGTVPSDKSMKYNVIPLEEGLTLYVDCFTIQDQIKHNGFILYEQGETSSVFFFDALNKALFMDNKVIAQNGLYCNTEIFEYYFSNSYLYILQPEKQYEKRFVKPRGKDAFTTAYVFIIQLKEDVFHPIMAQQFFFRSSCLAEVEFNMLQALSDENIRKYSK